MSQYRSRIGLTGWASLLLVCVGQLSFASQPNRDYVEVLSNVAVMEAGRVKPLDTVARHEIKQIFGRETIKLTDAEGKKTEWDSVSAFIDWQMPTRDEFWDNQAFILAEFVPLKELILTDSIRTALKTAAEDTQTDSSVKSRIEQLAGQEIIRHESLIELLSTSNLPATHKTVLEAFSKKLDVGSKWISPKDLEDSKVSIDGRTLAFEDWFRNLVGKKNGGGMGGLPTKLTEVENRAYEVGGRFAHYKGIRDRKGLGRTPIYTVIPRPSSEAYIKYTAEGLKKAIEGQESALSLLQRDAVEALDRYFEDIPKSDRAMPGTNAEFDRKYSDWLKQRSPWISLFTILESDDSELAEAGFDASSATKMRDAFRKIEAESQSGAITLATSSEFAAAIRSLGEKAGNYPSPTTLNRETHFNSFAPFFKAPSIYGTGLFFLLFSLVFSGIGESNKGFFAKAGKVTYYVGMGAFIGGILLEIYGFYLRIRISGWAPVTNMYETVIWVALVTAVIGLGLELIYRKIYAATAATGVALLATLLAANVSLLDPEIRSLQPVLRSNYWLTIHVLTIVSSYAAFALALGLGMLAVVYYLTATYRRSPSFISLLVPGLIGLPLLVFGYLAVSGAAGSFVTSESGYYASFALAQVGLVLSGASVFAFGGEILARLLFRSYAVAGLSAQSISNEAEVVDEQMSFSSTAESAHTESRSASIGSTAVMEPPVKVSTSKLIEQIRNESTHAVEAASPRDRSMADTAAKIKPLSTFIYRAMQVGVLLVAAGTILGGVWADYSWGRFWGWDPKEVWALIVLLVYLVPLHGRFAGWFNTFALVASSVVCFLSVMMAWYGVNFILGVGLHSYGFVEGGSQGVVMTACAGVCSIVAGAGWRRSLGNRSAEA